MDYNLLKLSVMLLIVSGSEFQSFVVLGKYENL